ncbi:MAG: PAS domain S-box protein [Candidatus Bathyarchaeota archaeon]|nr:PAS domain S-box protein [Candidatus Bathyarchaeota archaeon]
MFGGTSVIRVLHVDDDAAFLDVSKDLLELDGGFKVDTALSVDEAFSKLDSQKYDVVVSDYEMSPKDGLQFLVEFRQRFYGLPFVIFTGKGREEIAIKALNLGADGYVNKHGKPSTVYAELVHVIRGAIERAKMKSAFEENERICRLILEHCPVAIFIHDLEGRILDVNPQACTSVGYTREELLAMNIKDLEAGTYKVDNELLLKTLTGQQVFFEGVQRRKDGTTFPVEVTLVATKRSGQKAIFRFAKDIPEK